MIHTVVAEFGANKIKLLNFVKLLKLYDIPTYSPEPQKQQVTPLRLVINLPVAVHIAAFPMSHLTDAPF